MVARQVIWMGTYLDATGWRGIVETRWHENDVVGEFLTLPRHVIVLDLCAAAPPPRRVPGTQRLLKPARLCRNHRRAEITLVR